MRTRFPNLIRCLGVLAVAALCVLVIGPNVVLAQSGVDNSTTTGVFQMEGDTQRTATVCFLPVASGGPAIATPVAAGTNKTDANGCPTVSPSGTAATWNLVNWGANTNDWSSFGFSGGHFTNRANALFDPAFVSDPVNSSSDNTFLGASSKDTQDISQWNWNPHGVQDKDDIEHAGAGAYHLANGDTAIYAFMDRYSNAGDSTAGFWFVQDSTFALCTGNGTAANANGGNTPNPNCTATGTFVGHHTVGDLLIVSDFSIGGAVSTINIFEWNGSGITLTKSISPAPCMPDVGGDDFCGAVNNAFTQVLATKGKSAGQPILVAANVPTAGWTFNEKTQGATTYVTGEFLEIAVDLNKIFQGNLPCFSTFFSETRSSTSSTATLSDLTTPVSFPLCSLTASKQCDTASIVNGNQVQYTFKGDITNTGSSTLYSPVIYDTPPASTVAGSLTITQPTGPIPGNSSTNGHYTGSFISSSILSSTDLNRISAAASSSSTGTPLNVVCGANPPTGATDECADWGSACSPPVVTGLTVHKLCNTCLVGGTDLHVQVNEAFNVCNTGNVSVSSITVKDCEGGTYATGSCSGTEVTVATNLSLAPATFDSQGNLVAATCSTVINHTYTPTSTGACSGTNCSLHDEARASGTAALGQGTINSMATGADCPVCPIGTTCTPPTL